MAMAPAIAASADEVDEIPTATAAAPPWPSPRTAWYALVVFALALMFGILDKGIFSLMIETIKHDFALSDIEMGLLLGPAGIMFYVFIGIPMARLIDIYPRNIVLSLGIVVTSGVTALCGLVQGYGQLFLARMIVGVGGSAHGPGTYSMMADYFPPRKLPRAIAGLQVGFIVGTGLASIVGGALLGAVSHWEPTQFAGLTIRNWQWVLIWIGLPGLLIAGMIRMLPEPPRRGKVTTGKAMPIRDVLREVYRRRGVYFPLFVGLALSSIEAGGLGEWRVPFMQRTYGWSPQQVGMWSGVTIFISMPLGLFLGTWLTERLARRYKDAALRTTAIVFALAVPFAIASPLMPTGELAIIVASMSTVFSMAASVPQNAAIQTITPNEMRGQVTAIYLFMFTVFGALGSLMIASVTQFVIGDESKLWLALVLTAAVLMPSAAFAISRGLKPYGKEIEALEARGVL